MAPPFYLRIDKVRQAPQVRSRHTSDGVWRPPRPRGSNVIVPGDTTNQWYFYNGQQVGPVPVAEGQSLPPAAVHYKTFTIYHNHGSFRVVPYDASRVQVGDGSQDDDRSQSDDEASSVSSESEDETQVNVDWAQMGFRAPEPSLDDYSSCVTFGADIERERLRCHRADQHWMYELLPDRYHSQQLIQQANYGGMMGDLPILIALIAFSVPPRQVAAALGQCLRGQWQQHGQPRGVGWIDKRGMIVRIYMCAPTTPGSRSTPDELKAFENGQRGKVYP